MKSYAQKNEGICTFHKLKDFMEKGPAYYKAKYIDMLGRDISSDAFIIGRALEDKLKMESDAWNEKYEVVARRGGETEKEQLTKTQGKNVENGVFELNVNPIFTYNPKNASVYITTKHMGLTLGGEIDELDLKPWKGYEGCISDIKTTASLDYIHNYMDSYLKQLAFYQLLVESKHDVRLPGVIKAVSKESTAKAEMFLATPEVLLEYRTWIEMGLTQLREQMKSGVWPPLTWDICRQNDDLWGLVKQTEFTPLTNLQSDEFVL